MDLGRLPRLVRLPAEFLLDFLRSTRCDPLYLVEITHRNGVPYCNSGDRVESCAALVELHGETRELSHWSDACHSRKQVQAAADPKV